MRLATVLALLGLAACGADGPPARPSASVGQGVGSDGVSVGGGVGVTNGSVSVGIGI